MFGHEQLGLDRRPRRPPPHPEPIAPTDIDPAIAEAVDGVGNRFGAQGLEQMIAYAETPWPRPGPRSTSSPSVD